ncbi:MAG TPA: preprotein translocase subunit SecE [Myxococcaceae bacterium]|nr:preprotein translocase subunit SecE [Myxococcaceae bacterium]
MVTETEDGQAPVARTGTDPARLVVIFLLLMAVAVGMFLGEMIALTLAALNVRDPSFIEGLDWRLSRIVGYLLSFGTALALWMNARTRAFGDEVASELLKVTWPGWEEVRSSTTAVIVASFISAMILFAIDNFALRLMVDWIPQAWARLQAW